MTSCLQVSSSTDLTWVYWVALGCSTCTLSHSRKKTQICSPGRHSQRVHSHSHTHLPLPLSCHSSTQQPREAHPHPWLCTGSVVAAAPTSSQDTHSGTITLLSSQRTAFPQVQPGQGGCHTADKTLDPSPAAHVEPLPDVPSCGHMGHNARATQSAARGASVRIRHPPRML